MVLYAINNALKSLQLIALLWLIFFYWIFSACCSLLVNHSPLQWLFLCWQKGVFPGLMVTVFVLTERGVSWPDGHCFCVDRKRCFQTWWPLFLCWQKVVFPGLMATVFVLTERGVSRPDGHCFCVDRKGCFLAWWPLFLCWQKAAFPGLMATVFVLTERGVSWPDGHCFCVDRKGCFQT